MNVFTRRGILGAAGVAFARRPALAAAETFFPVANRIFFPNESGGSGSTNVLSRTHHLLFDDVSGTIRIQWPNLRATTGQGTSGAGGAKEIAPGAAATATANITYIDKATKSLVTVNLVDRLGGSTALTAPDGGLFDATATINAAKGDCIFPKIAATFPAGMVYAQKQADIPGGDLFQFGSSPIPLASTPTNSYAAGLSYYGPCSIRAETPIGSWGLCGDSRSQGITDVANDLWGNIGQVSRLLGRRLPVVNVSVQGETAADFAIASQSPVRRALLKQARSGVVLALGTNDIIFQGKSAAATKALVDRIASDLGVAASAIYATLDPVTTDGGNTAQGRPVNETQRRAFNTTVRGLTRRFDPAAVLESGGAGSPTGLWANASYVTSDGTHETNTGNQYAADNAGFDFGLVGSPAVVIAGFAYPTGPLYQSLGLADGWSTEHATLTTASLYSPEHRVTAALLKEDGTAGAHHGILKQVTAAIAGTTRTFTLFAKRVAGARNLKLEVQRTNDYAAGRTVVNLGTGAVFYNLGNGSNIVVAGATVTAVEDWWRIALSLTFAAGSNPNPYVFAEIADANGADSYNGDGASSVAVWGLDVR